MVRSLRQTCGRLPLYLLLALLTGCALFQRSPSASGIRLGANVDELKAVFGSAKPIIGEKGWEVDYVGKDGGYVYFFLDDKQKVKGVRIDTASYPGTAEGIKVGDTREKMFATYGKKFLIREDKELHGYTYNYRRGSQRLVFLYPHVMEQHIQSIIIDDRVEIFNRP